MWDVKYFAKEFIRLFPEYEDEYLEHIADYGKILGHIFFGTVIDEPLSRLLLENCDKIKIRKYIDFIDDMYSNGNNDVQNIVEVTILEYLGDNDTILKRAFSYFSEKIIMASKSIEEGLGRRNIRIFYKNGKMFTKW